MSEYKNEDVLKDEPLKEDSKRAEESENVKTETEAPPVQEEKKEEEKVDYYDKWLRVSAEYQNYRTRTQKEKEEIYQTANAKFAEDLLEVIDNFERAINSKPKESDAFTDGIELIYKQFLAILDKNHVKEIPALGEKFDPSIHMAIHAMAVEGKDSDIVVEVVKKGYTINEKVIRPSMVVVSQ